MKKIISNKIKTPDGTILESFFLYDYKSYKDRNGEVYSVDGGKQYLKRSNNKEPYEELSIYEDSPFEVIRENFCRGTVNKHGEELWVPISQMNNKHLRNCIVYNNKLGYGLSFANQMYRKELSYRKKNNIIIEGKEYE